MHDIVLQFKILQEQYSSLQISKNEEISILKQKLSEMEKLNQELENGSIIRSTRSINRSRSKSGAKKEKENQRNTQDLKNLKTSFLKNSEKSDLNQSDIRTLSQIHASGVWENLQGDYGNYGDENSIQKSQI